MYVKEGFFDLIFELEKIRELRLLKFKAIDKRRQMVLKEKAHQSDREIRHVLVESIQNL